MLLSPPAPPAAAAAAMAMEAPAQPAASLDCLPDHLLGRIMALAGREHGRSLILVSRRWHRLFFAEPAFWRSVHVDRLVREQEPELIQRLEQQAGLLRRVAPLVERFSLNLLGLGMSPAAEAAMAHCLSALQPVRLAELEIWVPVSSFETTGAALQRLAGVTSLALNSGNGQLVSATLSALGGHLRALQLEVDDLCSAVLDSIAQLAQLTALDIGADDWPPLGPLTRLSRLRQLELYDVGRAQQRAMQLNPIAGFIAGLECYSFESYGRLFQVGDCELMRCKLWQGTPTSRHAVPLLTLSLKCWRPLPSMARLLSALQLGGTSQRPVQQLEIEGSLPHAAGLVGCTQLRQLQELYLDTSFTAPSADERDSALAALLRNATCLTGLDLMDWDMRPMGGATTALPTCLASYRGLTCLTLLGQGLVDLPAGQYLADLHTLDISCNKFTRLPGAITAATALTSLRLTGNEDLRLCEEDAAVLRALPHLQQVRVANLPPPDPTLVQEMQRASPHLRIY